MSGKKDMRPRIVREFFASVHDQSSLSLDIFFLVKPTFYCDLVNTLKLWIFSNLLLKNSQRWPCGRNGILWIKWNNYQVGNIILNYLFQCGISKRSPVSHGYVGGGIQPFFLESCFDGFRLLGCNGEQRRTTSNFSIILLGKRGSFLC
jgi:hypothetical protein